LTATVENSGVSAELIDAARRATVARLPLEDAQSVHAWVALALKLLEGPLPAWARREFIGIDKAALEAAGAAIEGGRRPGDVRADELAVTFEKYLAQSDSGTLKGRRNSGSYFTPPNLIELVVERTLGPTLARATAPDELLSTRVFDPAVGAGGFLLSAGHWLANRLADVSGGRITIPEARRLVVEQCLYGADSNPLAVLLTSAILKLFASDGPGPGDHVHWADTILPHPPETLPAWGAPPLDTSNWFRGASRGFDAVIGNPPWGAVKPAIREFFAVADPSVLDRQGADLRERVAVTPEYARCWHDHSEQVRSYARALRDAGCYSHQGCGDADLYRYFIERAHQLSRTDGGRIGLLVPAAILRADGATPLRHLLFETGSIDTLIEFINSGRIFDIHSMFRFVMLIWEQGPSRGIYHARFGVRTAEEAERALEGPRTNMSLAFLDRVSGPRLTVPDVRSECEAHLLGRLYELHPRLDEPGCRWTPRFVRELDMTNDSEHFVHSTEVSDPSGVLPLYEGRMVHQFDNRAKRYEGGVARRAVWVPQEVGRRQLAPHFFVPREVGLEAGAGVERAGFCDVTGHANERTILAALIPADAAAGNKVPTVRFDVADHRHLQLIWLALANSFVIDWIARRRVATSLNFFQLAQLPFPRIEPASEVGVEVLNLVSELNGQVQEWTTSILRQRSRTRARLDAIVAKSFELDLRELALVLDDFPLLDRHQPHTGPGRSSSITRDLVLHTYAELIGIASPTLKDVGLPEDGRPFKLAERVVWAEDAGQIAYVPGENAKRLWSRRALAFE
jgi:N-6 DNA Methylase